MSSYWLALASVSDLIIIFKRKIRLDFHSLAPWRFLATFPSQTACQKQKQKQLLPELTGNVLRMNELSHESGYPSYNNPTDLSTLLLLLFVLYDFLLHFAAAVLMIGSTVFVVLEHLAVVFPRFLSCMLDCMHILVVVLVRRFWGAFTHAHQGLHNLVVVLTYTCFWWARNCTIFCGT